MLLTTNQRESRLKKGCAHTHEGEECPVHGKKECPNTVAAKVDEAVYGGEPEKKKDTRMTVTAADKKANTKAYQNYKAGDKRYKAADHMNEGDGDPCWDSHKQVGMKKKGNRMVPNCVPKNKVKESTEDSLRDRRMERGGLGGNVDYSRPPRNTNNEFGKKKPSGKSALDIVKAQIRAKHGKGAIMDTKKK